MRLRRIWPAALLLLVSALAGCSDDGGVDGSGVPTPTETTSSPAAATSSPAAPTSTASEAPPEPTLLPACDLVTTDDVAKAFGVSFGAAEPGSDTSSELDLRWTSSTCSFEAPDLLEVTVHVTGPDDFNQGTFGCPQPNDAVANVEPVDDIAGATDGWWRTSQAPPLEAALRACSATALVEVELEYEDGVDYEGDPRNQSVAIAELVLAALQG
ncbi:MAG: hypothetical protein NTX33_02425 [Propionibacteriales bacterium]|nr:hypothetical protein [Propionibacteriales bacterium]